VGANSQPYWKSSAAETKQMPNPLTAAPKLELTKNPRGKSKALVIISVAGETG